MDLFHSVPVDMECNMGTGLLLPGQSFIMDKPLVSRGETRLQPIREGRLTVNS